MKLYLIRHGESANNALESSGGAATGRSPDPELTEAGHQQAALLGPHLAHPGMEPRQHPTEPMAAHDFGLTHLYCSLMTRSILTANYIADACGLQPVALPDLFERGGIYEEDENGQKSGKPGPNRTYFSERFPDLILPDSLGDAGWYSRPAESTEDFLLRLKRVVADLKERHLETNDHVAMVVHGDFIDQFVNELMGVVRHSANYTSPWIANWAFHNTSISRIDFRGDAQTVLYLNRIDHLPPELITW